MTEEHKLNFMSGILKLKLLHGITMDENEYLEIANIAWYKIADRELKIYKHEVVVTDCIIPLPCNYYYIEAVVTPMAYCQCNNFSYTGYSPIKYYNESLATYYGKPFNSDLYNITGGFINYSIENDSIVLEEKDFQLLKGSTVTIYYKGLVVDDSGLPKITEAQAEAISYYCAYIYMQRKMMMGIGDGSLVQLLESKWRRLCANARVDEYLSQNAVDKILDAKTSWDRKRWNKSMIV